MQGTKPDNTSTMYAALKAAEEIVARAQVANSIQHELPDHFDDHITACSVRKWANRPCKSGKHDVPLNTDFCGECGEFVDGIVICPICQSPNRKQQDSSKKQLCRGRFNLVPCNLNDEEIKKEFLPPKPINIKHASLRYARLLQRDKERVDGSYRAYTITLLPAVPAETAGSHIKSSAAPVPVTAPFVGLIPDGRPSAVAMLTTSSPSAPSLTPTAALTDFHIGWSAADSVRGDSIAADNSASTRLTSPGAHRLSNDQPGNTTQKGGFASSSLTATQAPPPVTGYDDGRADATQVSFQLVLPGPDDSPKISHQSSVVPPKERGKHAKSGVVSGRAGKRGSNGRRPKFVAGPPTHPLLLAGKPVSCKLQFLEVRDQEQPLFSLGVLEKSAKKVGIILRLETCPAEDGASWLALDGIGRIPVSRIGGLVLIGYRMLSPGNILIGCSSVHTALIDTGAQVCLFSKMSRLLALQSAAYTGPPLRGADNAFVACQSAADFVLHFDLEAALPCLPRTVAVVTAVPMAALSNDTSEGATVYAARQDSFVEEPKAMTEGRTSHCRKLRGADVVHTRLGVTDPAVFRALAKSAVGVEAIERSSARFTTLAYVQQASTRTAIRHAKILRELPRPGESASLDFTRSFVLDLDGNVCAAVILDIATYSIWVYPLPAKTGRDAARAVIAYRAHVRERYGTELRALRADSDPSFSANGHGQSTLAADLHLALTQEMPHVSVTFSPPYSQALNPVEGAVGHLFHLLNFFLAQSYLSMLA